MPRIKSKVSAKISRIFSYAPPEKRDYGLHTVEQDVYGLSSSYIIYYEFDAQEKYMQRQRAPVPL